MRHRFGFSIHYFLVFMVIVACATQVEDQGSGNASSESAIKKEMCILPHHAYHLTVADFEMRDFNFQTDKDSIVPTLKKRGDAADMTYSAYLPQVPDWMDTRYAKDSLYRSAYLSYVQHFVNSYQQNGISISVLYVPRNSRQTQFATVEELASVVKCQICLTDSMPDLPSRNSWKIIEKENK